MAETPRKDKDIKLTGMRLYRRVGAIKGEEKDENVVLLRGAPSVGGS